MTTTTRNTNSTRYMDARQIVDGMIEAIGDAGGVPTGIYTVEDLRAVLTDRGLLGDVLPGHGGHDPTIGRWLDERADDIIAELAAGANRRG
jgi:hypothetical protein